MVSPRSVLATFAVVSLLSCQKAAPGSPQPPEVSAPVTVSVGPQGGTFSATDGAGNALTLTFPAGAVAAAQEITLTPLPTDGVQARFGISPPGLTLALPVTATLHSAAALPAESSFYWLDAEGWNALGGSASGTELTVTLPSLGYPAQPATRSRPTSPAPTPQLAVASLDCEFEAFQLAQQVKTASQKGDAESARREGETLKALRKACTQERIEVLTAAVCDRFQSALQTAEVTAVNDRASFDQVAGALLGAVTGAYLAGADSCVDPAWEGVYSAKVDQLLTFMDAAYNTPPYSPATFEQDLDRMKALFGWEAQCQQLDSLSPPPCTPLRQKLFPGLLDRLRDAAYEDCLASGHADLLAEIFTYSFALRSRAPGDKVEDFAGYSYAELASDLTHCGAHLKLRVYEDAQGVPSERKELEQTLDPAPVAGKPNDEATLEVLPGSSLMVSGVFPLPPCSGFGTAQDELVFRLNGREVARRHPKGHAITLTPDVEVRLDDEALTALALPTRGTLLLELVREGTSCMGHALPSTLFKVNVTVKDAGLEWSLLGPGWWDATRVTQSLATGMTCDFQTIFATTTDSALASNALFPRTVQTSRVAFTGKELDAGFAVLALSVDLPAAAVTDCGGGSFTVASSSAEVHAALRLRAAVAGTFTVTPRWESVLTGSSNGVEVYRIPDGGTFTNPADALSVGASPGGGAFTVHLTPPEELLVKSNALFQQEAALSAQNVTVMELLFSQAP